MLTASAEERRPSVGLVDPPGQVLDALDRSIVLPAGLAGGFGSFGANTAQVV